MNIKVRIHEAEEGGFWAEVPALHGCVSQGETLDETVANVREAIAGWLGPKQAEALILPELVSGRGTARAAGGGGACDA